MHCPPKWTSGTSPAVLVPRFNFFTHRGANTKQGAGGQVDQVRKVATKSAAEGHVGRGAQEEQQPGADVEGDGQRLPQEQTAQVCFQ